MSNKRKIYRTISLISLIIMLVAIGMILWIFHVYHKSNREYMALADSVRAEAAPVSQETDRPAENGQEETILPDEEETPISYVSIPINFDYLAELNEDIIGWILVDGTDIDYPILYDDTTERYYLYHNYVGVYTFYGSIFMLGENAPDYSDFNTVLYGHNMLDGKMFAQLHYFEDPEFFDEHDSIVIYTPDRKLTYRIFAAYRTDNLNIIVNNDFSTPELREDYLEKIYTHDVKSLFNYDVAVSAEDKILTLSTCINNSAYRYLVQGVLISDEPGQFAVG